MNLDEDVVGLESLDTSYSCTWFVLHLQDVGHIVLVTSPVPIVRVFKRFCGEDALMSFQMPRLYTSEPEQVHNYRSKMIEFFIFVYQV